eukprot:1741811-Pyramimonas_sp.AAC.2
MPQISHQQTIVTRRQRHQVVLIVADTVTDTAPAAVAAGPIRARQGWQRSADGQCARYCIRAPVASVIHIHIR